MKKTDISRKIIKDVISKIKETQNNIPCNMTKKIEELLKVVENTSPKDINILLKDDFIAFVRFKDKKIKYYFNFIKLKNNQDRIYAYFHEFMHISLKHFALAYENPTIRNIVHDIEVNMYVDKLTNISPQLHVSLYINKFRNKMKNPIISKNALSKREFAFVYYIISRNVIKKYYKDIETFAKEELTFISDSDRQHWIEFSYKLDRCEVNLIDLIAEIQFWGINSLDKRVKEINLVFPYGISGTGKKGGKKVGNNIGNEEIKEIEKFTPYRLFFRKVKNYLDKSKDLNKGYGIVQYRSVLPINITRREAALLNNGIDPVFYTAKRERLSLQYTKLNIYVDTSGSMQREIPYIINFVNYLKKYTKQIYMFDMFVYEFEMEEFLSGVYKGGGGTDINVVLEHIRKNRIRNAIIISDLYWGIVDERLINELNANGVNLFVLGIAEEGRDHLPDMIERDMKNVVKETEFVTI